MQRKQTNHYYNLSYHIKRQVVYNMDNYAFVQHQDLQYSINQLFVLQISISVNSNRYFYIMYPANITKTDNCNSTPRCTYLLWSEVFLLHILHIVVRYCLHIVITYCFTYCFTYYYILSLIIAILLNGVLNCCVLTNMIFFFCINCYIYVLQNF